jgi:serine protease Do
VVIYETALLVDENGNAAEKPLSVEAIAALVENSVVEITTEAIVSGSFMQQYVSEGAGSGVIFTTDGYIVTNNHVIEGATNITVRLKNGDSYEAELVGADAKTDLAVIKIKASGLKPAAFGKSSALKVGETVVAVGNPLGKLGGTVTQGIISALDRQIDIDNTTMSLLQTDTAINPGNSGGGLFNTSGQLIGVVNAKSAGEELEGLGFAIPIDTAKKVIEDLIDFGYVKGRPNVGIEYISIRDTMTAMMYNVNELGLYIYTMEEGSDAAAAGLQSGDLIVTVDGKEVGSAADANAIFDQKKIGDTVEVVVRRNRKDVTVTMTLTEYAPKKEAVKPNL